MRIRKNIKGIKQLSDLPWKGSISSILVIAPHPDDETLGAGGIIQQALAVNSQVRIVYITNGDGFRRGAQKQCGRLMLKPADYIAYGQLRQSEALSALGTLGLSPQQATFLGYPDKGLTSLWLRGWNRESLYVSRYTRHANSPYENSYQPKAPYKASALLRNLIEIINEYHPTAIYTPHPADTHPDHRATTAFVKAAAAQTAKEGRTIRPELYTYIIHRGTWRDSPVTPLSRNLAPPAGLWRRDTLWYQYHLPPKFIELKEKAIGQYQSQLRIMRRFMFNFLGPTEIFCALDKEFSMETYTELSQIVKGI